MVPQSKSLLIVQLALLRFFFLLTIDNAEEVVALGFGLVSHSALTVEELALTGNLKFGGLTLELLALGDLLPAGLALTFLEGALCAEGINL